MKNNNKKREKNKVKSRDRRVQERRAARKIYGEVVIWVGQ